MLEGKGLSVARRSLGDLPDRTSDAYVADTIGELGMLYKLAPVAFIGGSLVDRGGQNPIEAVRQGAAVLAGPHWQNFSDAYKALISNARRHRRALRRRKLAAAAGQLLADQTELGSMRSARRQRRWPPSRARCRARWRRCCATCRPKKVSRVRLDEPAWWYRIATSGMAGLPAPLGAIYGWAVATRYCATPALSLPPAVDLRRQFHRRRHGQDAAGHVICASGCRLGGQASCCADPRLRRTARRAALGTQRRHGRDVGDEALLLARAAPTLVARDRAAGRPRHRSGPDPADVIVMDDGLQNPSLAKDLAIAVVDGRRGLGNGLVIPAGPLRAPLEFQLGLADAIVVNGPHDPSPAPAQSPIG